jgi:hypothetical protein
MRGWSEVGRVEDDGRVMRGWNEVGTVDNNGDVMRGWTRVGCVEDWSSRKKMLAGGAALLLLFDDPADEVLGEEKNTEDRGIFFKEKSSSTNVHYEPYITSQESGPKTVVEAIETLIVYLMFIDFFLIIGGLYLGAMASVTIGLFVHVVPSAVLYFMWRKSEVEIARVLLVWFATAALIGLFVYAEVKML